MITFGCVVALVATMATPVNLLKRVWEASLAKALYDAATNAAASPASKAGPTSS